MQHQFRHMSAAIPGIEKLKSIDYLNSIVLNHLRYQRDTSNSFSFLNM